MNDEPATRRQQLAQIDFNTVHRIRVFGGRVVHSVNHHTPAEGSRRAVFHTTTCDSHYVGPNEGHWLLPPDAEVTCRACLRKIADVRPLPEETSVAQPIQPLTPERRAEICATWQHVKNEPDASISVTGSSTPGSLVNALSRACTDVRDLLAEVERLTTEVGIAQAAAKPGNVETVRSLVHAYSRLVTIERDSSRKEADELRARVAELEQQIRSAADTCSRSPLCVPTLCAHCGRVCGDRIGGHASVEGQPVCHPNFSDRPDCYHLVTVYGEELGKRRGQQAGVQ